MIPYDSQYIYRMYDCMTTSHMHQYTVPCFDHGSEMMQKNVKLTNVPLSRRPESQFWRRSAPSTTNAAENAESCARTFTRNLRQRSFLEEEWQNRRSQFAGPANNIEMIIRTIPYYLLFCFVVYLIGFVIMPCMFSWLLPTTVSLSRRGQQPVFFWARVAWAPEKQPADFHQGK